MKYRHYLMQEDTISRNNTVCMLLQQARVQCASADTRISLYDVLSPPLSDCRNLTPGAIGIRSHAVLVNLDRGVGVISIYSSIKFVVFF